MAKESLSFHPKSCLVEGCASPQKYYTAGYCIDHYHLNPRFKNKKCAVDQCGRKHVGRGYCAKHLLRLRRIGTVHLEPKPTLAERFWPMVDKTPGQGTHGKCWIWIGGTDNHGYGKISYKGESRKTTHVVWFLTYGKFPDKQMLHRCDNPSCVNPDDLYEGMPADNYKDMVSRNRIGRKYSDYAIREVRRLRRQGLSHKQIVSITGVKPSSVATICSFRQWKTVV